jgi:hypothetical protein
MSDYAHGDIVMTWPVNQAGYGTPPVDSETPITIRRRPPDAGEPIIVPDPQRVSLERLEAEVEKAGGWAHWEEYKLRRDRERAAGRPDPPPPPNLSRLSPSGMPLSPFTIRDRIELEQAQPNVVERGRLGTTDELAIEDALGGRGDQQREAALDEVARYADEIGARPADPPSRSAARIVRDVATRPFGQAEKRRRVKELIREQPTASNRTIAKQATVSHTTVAKARTELYAELAAERGAGER